MRAIRIIFFALASACIASCDNEQGQTNDLRAIFTHVYNADNLSSSKYSINAERDTVLTSPEGVKIHIPAKAFVNSKGEQINGNVELDFKAALTPEEMVLANLTTTYNGKSLESGGMIFLGASSKEEQLQLAGDKSIDLAVPADTVLPGMSIFEGVQDSAGIKWENPVEIRANNIKIAPVNQDTAIAPENNKFKVLRTNVTYTLEGFYNDSVWPEEVERELARIAWKGDGLKITKDSSMMIGKYKLNLHYNDSFFEAKEFIGPVFNMATFNGNVNSFSEDNSTNYIFSIKKLGWANIDRLYDDPRAKEVELITSIDNHSDFSQVYITMIFEKQKIYLPGYQMKDGTYSFTHGDYEKPVLPVGEQATILATAYKNDRPYFSIQKITISPKQSVSFMLKETTIEKLKEELKNNI
jgi:hypothetical protein